MEFVVNVLYSTLRVSTPLILAAMAGALSKQVNYSSILLWKDLCSSALLPE